MCCYTEEEGKCCCFHLRIGGQLCCQLLGKWRTIVLLYLGNEGQLYCYTREMVDNCAVTLQKWRTIVLLHLGNGEQLWFYTWEMEDNCAFTLGKWRKIVLLHLQNDGQLYSLHLEKWWPIVQFTSRKMMANCTVYI